MSCHFGVVSVNEGTSKCTCQRQSLDDRQGARGESFEALVSVDDGSTDGVPSSMPGVVWKSRRFGHSSLKMEAVHVC